MASKKLIQFLADDNLINKVKKIKEKHFKNVQKCVMLKAFVEAFEKTQKQKGE